MTEVDQDIASLSDPVNRRLLSVSEDTLVGFHRDPIGEIASRADLPVETVIERIRALLRVGVVRRVRQTLLTHNLAEGALVAWRIPEERLDAAFRMMSERDPDTVRDIWAPRASAAGLSLQDFCVVAESLARRKLLGRFSTFLERSKPVGTGAQASRHSALVQWAVPPGQELAAGGEIGRHKILTHCYWREAGPEFGNLNIMGVIHGLERDGVLAHKAAIDDHLNECGFAV